MRVIFCILLAAFLALPVIGQGGEVVIMEDPYTVVECAAVLGEITIGDNDPAPLYATLLHGILGEDMGEWDSVWQTFFLLFTSAAVDCENEKTTVDEQQSSDEPEETIAGETEDAALGFSSTVDGQEPLLGPIILQSGIYVVTLTSDTLTSAKLQAVAECDGDMAYGMLIYQDEGKVQERLDIESDCRFTIQVDSSGDWELAFNELDSAEETEETIAVETGDIGLEFSSTANGQEPLLGPITLQPSIYIVTLTSDALTSAEFEAVAECDGDMAYGMLIYQDEGKVQERLDIESDCRLTIQIDSSGDWELILEQL